MALNTSISEKFKGAFEDRCFQLMIDAYHTSLAKGVIQLDWNENDISSELQEHIENNPLRIRWKVSATRELHISKDGIPKIKGFADKFPRIDFRLTSFTSNNEYKYYFEAKRLKEKDSHLKREYINEGIDRFVTQKYPNGCMVGYLLDGEPTKTVNGINSLLEKDKRNSETLLQRSNRIHSTYYESNHSNIGVLKHLIFDYSTMAS